MKYRGTAVQRGYGARWQKARTQFLAEHPTCAMCAQQDPPRLTPATVVDHVKPHKGDMELFWDTDNWQSLCKPCHDRHKQRAERSGRVVGCDAAGIPLEGWK